MIGIHEIATYIPETRVDNLARAAEAGKSESFIVDKIGFQAVTRKNPDDDTSDLCVHAYNALREKMTIDKEKVDCVIVCTQNPDSHGLPHTAAAVHAKLGLGDNVAAFDISLGCSGFVYAHAVMQNFMEAQGLQAGLLFTADPYSKVLDTSDYDTELLFGDAAAVTFMNTKPVFKTLGSKFASNGSLRHSIQVSDTNGKLSMLGSNVFKFSMTAVPRQIGECLKECGLELDDIDLFLFHQGSKFIVDNLAKKLRLAPEKVPFVAAQTGNTVSSTVPQLLEPYVHSDEKIILVSGFGVGLSWATSILERIS